SMLHINGTFEKMNGEIKYLERWSQGKVTPIIIDEVYKQVPVGPQENWPINIYKDIARKLNISNNMVSKSFNILLEQNKLPKDK
ncbi:hypothetical protein OHV98_13910, partial [Acinetobacter baumannii]|nr:hypothetical protein [Acinetobacter baumannii]